MAVNSDSFGRLKVTIARLCGDHKESGTATAGSTTTVTDTKKFTDANDSSPRLTGKWLYIWNGASQGTEVRTTAFTASTDTITIPTSTAIDSTSEYLITERFSNTDITTAIRTVISRYGRHALGYVDRSLIAGSPINNGTFYLFPTSPGQPTGWTEGGASGTFTKETSVVKRGKYSLKMVSAAGTNASSYQDVANPGAYRGLSVTAHAWIFCNTTAVTSININDGINVATTTVTGANRGWGTAEVSVPATISDRATIVRVECLVLAGSNTAYFSGVWLEVPFVVHQYAVPGSPSIIQRMRYDDGPTGYGHRWFDMPMPEDNLTPIEESTRLFTLDHVPPQGSIMELQGRQAYTNLAYNSTTADDTSYEGVTDWIAHEAALFLLMGANDAGDQARIANLNYALADLRRGKKMRVPAGAAVIERQ